MILFWLCALLMALLVGIVIAAPLLATPHKGEDVSLTALNIRVFRDRLQELEADFSAGRIDQETYQGLRLELERGILAGGEGASAPVKTDRRNRWLFLLVLAVLPVAASGFYYLVVFNPALPAWWSSSQAIAPVIDDVMAGRQPPATDSQFSWADFIRGLQLRLQKTPNDAQAWFMVGLGYMQLNMNPQAGQAFERAWRLTPDRPEVDLAYAQSLIGANEGKLTPQARDLLQSVLKRFPQHEGALILLGVGAYRANDYGTAVDALATVQSLRKRHEGGLATEATQQLDSMLHDARAQLAAGGKPVDSGSGIIVVVSIDPALATKVAPGDTLFVFAKAVNGPPMPLAVVRQPANGLPVTVELNDSQGMLPSMKLSSVSDVLVEARISHSGSPMPSAGDLEAIASPLHQNGKPARVELLIRQQRP